MSYTCSRGKTVKFKFVQSEFEFDRDNAKIGVPLVLLALGLAFTPVPKTRLLAGAGVYYLLLFFLPIVVEPLKKWIERLHTLRKCRCPYCRSLHTVTLGLQEYLGDVPYYWYRCNDCGEDSVCVDDRLIVPSPGKKRKLTRG
jgi:DNA-directed RNA polymerase subunit RPC12/RpoP